MSVMRPNVPLRYDVEIAALLLIRLNTEKVTSTEVRLTALNFLAIRRPVTGTRGPCCAPHGSILSVTVPWLSLGSENVCVRCPSAPDDARKLNDALISQGSW